MGARRRSRVPYSVRGGAVGCCVVVLVAAVIAWWPHRLPITLVGSAAILGLWAVAEYRRTKPKD